MHSGYRAGYHGQVNRFGVATSAPDRGGALRSSLFPVAPAARGRGAVAGGRSVRSVQQRWLALSLTAGMALLAFWDTVVSGHLQQWTWVPALLANAPPHPTLSPVGRGQGEGALAMMRAGLREERGRLFSRKRRLLPALDRPALRGLVWRSGRHVGGRIDAWRVERGAWRVARGAWSVERGAGASRQDMPDDLFTLTAPEQPLTGPAWFERLAQWVRERVLGVLVAAAVVQGGVESGDDRHSRLPTGIGRAHSAEDTAG